MPDARPTDDLPTGSPTSGAGAPVLARCPAMLCGMHPPHPYERDGQRAHCPGSDPL